MTIVATDNAGNTTTLKTTAPAGVAGHPINLGLAGALPPQGALATITVSGVPSGWTLNAGTSSGNGVWTVQTANPGGLAITPAEQFAGALTLNVTETWTQASGGTATTSVADNVAVFAPQSPIYAWSGDDNLTGKGGDDLFVFTQPIGDDAVYDFNPASDQLDLTGLDDVESYSDIQSDLPMTATETRSSRSAPARRSRSRASRRPRSAAAISSSIRPLRSTMTAA